jgi:hypothetical protein
MATITGTIDGITLLAASSTGVGARKTYLVTASFGAYTGATDDAKLAGVGAAIASFVRNGKTNSLVGALPHQGGLDTNAQAVYFSGASVKALSVSGDDLTGNLTNAAGTELSSSTASSGVGIIVTVDES